MSGLFDERERAAETAFVHEEELRFLAHRRAIQSLAAWASDGIGLDEDGAKAYEATLIDQFIANTPDEKLIQRVQSDLERAGKPSMTTQVGVVFSKATAAAIASMRGGPAAAGHAADPLEDFEKRHKAESSSSWGSLKF